jgi:hypothetical protein
MIDGDDVVRVMRTVEPRQTADRPIGPRMEEAKQARPLGAPGKHPGRDGRIAHGR